MKDFNFKRYKALVSYSMVENKKTYLSAFGICLLVFVLAFMLIGHSFAYGFGSEDLTDQSVQDAIEIPSFLASYVFFAVMMFVVTQVEVANRYCIAREGTQYCLLPATYKEKGWAILTQFAIFEFLGPAVFYLIVYCFLSLYYMIYGGEFTFQPFAFIESMGDTLLSRSMYTNPMENAITLLIWMLPVSLVLNLLYYLVLVTCFRTKAQLKAYGLQIVIANVLTWVFMGCLTLFGILYETSISFQVWVETTFDDPSVAAYVVDALVLLQIPVAILFGWWFFRRLHYKEIK